MRAMTANRIIVPGAVTAVTRRTNLRKAFLGDWHPMVEQIFLYALGDALRVTGVDLHHAVRMPNHVHLAVTPNHPNLPVFTRRFFGDLSCAINELLRHERYDMPRQVFDGRRAHYMRLMDVEAQIAWMVYQHLNPVAAGLVARPELMPGRVIDFGMLGKEGLVIDKPDVYFDKGRPSQNLVASVPTADQYLLYDGNVGALRHDLEKLARRGAQDLRAEQKRPPMGAQKLRRIHPWSEPRTLAEAGGQRVSTFKVGAPGLVGKALRQKIAVGVTAYRGRYRDAMREWKDGDHFAVFPHGTYQQRVLHGVAVDEPDPELLIAMPGPTLADAQDEVDERRRRRQETGNPIDPTERHATLQKVASAIRDEAAEIVEHHDVEYLSPKSKRATSETETTRPEPLVRHRFDPRLPPDAEHPRRLVTLRDKRRGRPVGQTAVKRGEPAGDGDPPR